LLQEFSAVMTFSIVCINAFSFVFPETCA